MKIEEVEKEMHGFFKKTFHKDAKIVKISKEDGGWLTEAVVYEPSAFIKSLGLPTRVMDRNIYEFRLTDDLEVVSYGLKEEMGLKSMKIEHIGLPVSSPVSWEIGLRKNLI